MNPNPFRGPMWTFAVVGAVAGLIALATGIHEAAEHKPQGAKMIWIAAVCLVLLAILIPLARRRGRM